MNKQNNALLLADIGNTSIKLGFAIDGEITHSFSLPTRSQYSADSLGLLLMQMLNVVKLEKVSQSFVCSVVPELLAIYRQACSKYLSVNVLSFPDDFKIDLNNSYKNPHEVGADRLMAAYAARVLYPESAGIISVDYGTATTFDCLAHNNYMGGLICPGLLSSRNALAKNTAKLPKINLEVNKNEPLIGQNTSTSINHGFIFGFVAMTEGLCERLKQQLPQPLCVIATGGFAEEIAKLSTCIDHIHPNLILEGLKFAGQNNLLS